jgi:hypothetical protein
MLPLPRDGVEGARRLGVCSSGIVPVYLAAGRRETKSPSAPKSAAALVTPARLDRWRLDVHCRDGLIAAVRRDFRELVGQVITLVAPRSGSEITRIGRCR